jgi:hypothetical protein
MTLVATSTAFSSRATRRKGSAIPQKGQHNNGATP